MIDHKSVLSIINAALGGAPANVSPDASIDEYVQFARMQQIEALMIIGLSKSGVLISEDVRRVLYGAVAVSVRQLSALKQLCETFDEHDIDYMPLKGSMLKNLYPSNEMRSMGDIDILVRIGQYERIRPLMLEEGYEEDHESDHEYVWNGKGVHVELHKLFFQPSNQDYFDYFGECWQFARKTDKSHCYEMSPEDTLIYLFTHFSKHYRNAGVGLRQAIDFHVYRRAYPDIDETYVLEKMRLLRIERFYENTMHMLDVWFEDAEHTEASQLISDRLFSSGVFGKQEDLQQSKVLRRMGTDGTVEKIKLRIWFERIFLPLSGMSKLYPILRRLPVFLPVMWIVRCFDVVLRKRECLHSYIQKDKKVSRESVKAYQDILRKSGLDFNFKR